MVDAMTSAVYTIWCISLCAGHWSRRPLMRLMKTVSEQKNKKEEKIPNSHCDTAIGAMSQLTTHIILNVRNDNDKNMLISDCYFV